MSASLFVASAIAAAQPQPAPPPTPQASPPPAAAPVPPVTTPPPRSYAPPPPPPPPRRDAAAEPARPRAELSSYVRQSDYPRSALRAGYEGSVRFRLTVATDGRVSNCQVTASSGASALDNATCSLMRRRARFTPARGFDGNPTTDVHYGRVIWRLPGDRPASAAAAPPPPVIAVASPPPLPARIVPSPPVPAAAPAPLPPPPRVVEPARARANLASYVSASDYPPSALANGEQGVVRFRLLVGEDGRVRDCAITVSSGSAALDAATCSILRRRARFTPARDSNGNPASDSVESSLVWRLPAMPAAPATAPPPAAAAGPLRLIVTVGPAGEITECRALAPGPYDAGLRACADIMARAGR